VFGAFGRRAVESVVVLFAVLGFGFVPLGSKTGLEHTLALSQTRPARDAAAGLVSALDRVRTLVVRAVVPDAPGSPLPLPSSGTAVSRVLPRLKGGKPTPDAP
jgi:hypothetical protein